MGVSSNTLRMAGMNSGLDTEAIVNAMTASTKLRITTNQRKILKLEAQQEAYREITTSIQDFKNKYFDVLGGNYLKTATIFNQYSTAISVDGQSATPAGVSVKSSTNATSGNYSVKLNNVATQSQYTSKTLDSNQEFDASDYADGSTYALNITVGETTKTISFSGNSEAEVAASLNESLKSAFGKTNNGDGLVSVSQNSSTGKYNFSAADKSAITTSAAVKLGQSVELSGEFTSGSNSLNVTIDGETKPIVFSTVSGDYFDEIFPSGADDEVDADGFLKDADKTKVALYKEIVSNMHADMQYEAYEDWKSSDPDYVETSNYDEMSQQQKDLVAQAAEIKNNERKETYFQKALVAAYDEYYAEQKAAGNSYQSYDEWTAKYSIDDFSANDEMFASYYEDYEGGRIEEADYKIFAAAGYNEYSSYKTAIYETTSGNMTSSEYLEYAKANLSPETVANYLNETNIKNNLGNLSFADGTKVEVNYTYDSNNIVTGVSVSAYTEDEDGNKTYKDIGISSNSGYDFGLESTNTTASTLSTSTKLSELGLTADEDGNYNIEINGEKFSFAETATIKEMMTAINSNSKANVTMSFSTLSNSFVLKSNDYGTASAIDVTGDAEGLFGKLGFDFEDDSLYTQGKNLSLTVNGHTVETASNSYTVDGTTFTFNEQAVEGSSFNVEVARDYSKAKEAIKSFIEDYNALIEKVYGYVDQKPADGDYYFLTDDDRTELELTDKQEELWDTAAKKGILYNDSTLTGVMSKFRNALYGSVESADGSKFALYNMGISTTSNWQSHGKLELDEEKFNAAFDNNVDQIISLFTDKDNGIMNKFESLITQAVGTSGTRGKNGTLISKAGVANGSSATNNQIYDQIKSLTSMIASLESRYEKQQDRYWSIYSSLETQMGTMNSQTSYIQSLLGQ